MVKQYTANQVVERLKKERDFGRYIYAVSVGSGISAKFAEAGGADLITTHNMARLRMKGMSSMAGYLPLCDANATMLEMGKREILTVLKDTPVCVGLLGVDPTRDMVRFLDDVKAAGFSGVINCPTIDLITDRMRKNLEETGLPYQREVDLMAMAVKKDLYVQAFCATVEHAKMMADVGAHMIVMCMGNTIGGSIGNKTSITLDEAVERTNQACKAVKSAYPDVLVVSHGGPLVSQAEYEHLIRHCPKIDGFMGGSSGERLPVEESIAETTRQFKSVQ